MYWSCFDTNILSNMSFLLNIVLCLLFLQCDSLQPELCKQPPQEKHCLIEYSVRYRWPHKVRYVYNWYMKNCFEIRWASYCPVVPKPTVTNNFPSEKECLDECGGWA